MVAAGSAVPEAAEALMLVWRIHYKPTERGPWEDTGCHAPDAPSAWKLWVMWRTVHYIEEWYAVQIFEVSLVALLAEQQGRKERNR
jgi:hypothetical protein